MRAKTLILLSVVCYLLVSGAYAKNLGVYGSVFPIKETNFLTFIKTRLLQLKQSGELKAMQQAFIKRAVAHTLRPSPVKNLTTTSEPHTFYYDPSFVLSRTLEDTQGRVIYPAGTQIHPLSKIHLHEIWLFFNADDPRQLYWAKARYENAQKTHSDLIIKAILVRGDIQKTARFLKQPIYFDQAGVLTQKFHLKHIPCVMRQKGQRLQFQEIAYDTLPTIEEGA